MQKIKKKGRCNNCRCKCGCYCTIPIQKDRPVYLKPSKKKKKKKCPNTCELKKKIKILIKKLEKIC